jgi:hypothetical protein
MPFKSRLHGKELEHTLHTYRMTTILEVVVFGHGSHPTLIPLSSIAIPLFENPPHMGGHMSSRIDICYCTAGAFCDLIRTHGPRSRLRRIGDVPIVAMLG